MGDSYIDLESTPPGFVYRSGRLVLTRCGETAAASCFYLLLPTKNVSVKQGRSSQFLVLTRLRCLAATSSMGRGTCASTFAYSFALSGRPYPRLNSQPELLSRFIPPDPWVGRVSLSPQAPPMPAGVVPHGAAASGRNGGGEALGGSRSGSVVADIGISGGIRTPRPQGIAGLRNDGNWCYLNATLQALARCAPFRAHLVECASRPEVAARPW